MTSKVKDPSLAGQGRLKIEWAESRMPVLMKLKSKYAKEKPLKGLRVSACLHVTKETAVLARALLEAGADVALVASNPLSTQDDVAAALVEDGAYVYAWRGETAEEYYWAIRKAIEHKPDLTMDDGADLVVTLHAEYPDVVEGVIGGTEETTTGVLRLEALAKEGKLKYPIIAVNNAETKWDFDNVYGTGQSTIDGIIRATNVLLAGKTFVVAGYGHCGRGLAMRARGMGAKVVVTEVDPIKALKAAMEGFLVMPMLEAAKVGDIFVTVTGCKDVITAKHFELMKDGAILANSGHFNVEINVNDLEAMALRKREVRQNNVEYTLPDGRRLYLLAEGRLVNLAAAEGHPSEVMDMSFANQFLSLLYLLDRGKELRPSVYNVPREQDKEVAMLKLEAMGIEIDRLTQEQLAYLTSYSAGT